MGFLAYVTEEEFKNLSAEDQKNYIKKSGNLFNSNFYYYDIDPRDGVGLENVSGLKSALSSERSRGDEAEKKLKNFQGVNPDDIANYQNKLKEMENWTPEQKVQERIEQQAKQLQDKYKKEKEKDEAEKADLVAQLGTVLIDNVATAAILADNPKNSVKLLLPHIREMCKIEKDVNGKYAARVVDETGNIRVSPTQGSTAPMIVGELIPEMKTQDEFKAAFMGSGAVGDGTKTKDGQHRYSRGTTMTIDINDQNALNDHFEEIANGEVTIVDSSL